MCRPTLRAGVRNRSPSRPEPHAFARNHVRGFETFHGRPVSMRVTLADGHGELEHFTAAQYAQRYRLTGTIAEEQLQQTLRRFYRVSVEFQNRVPDQDARRVGRAAGRDADDKQCVLGSTSDALAI